MPGTHIFEFPEAPPGGEVSGFGAAGLLHVRLRRGRLRAVRAEPALELILCAAACRSSLRAAGCLLDPGRSTLAAAGLTSIACVSVAVAFWLLWRLIFPEVIELTPGGLARLTPVRSLYGLGRALLLADLRRYLPELYARRMLIPRRSIRDVRLVGPDFGGRIELDLGAGTRDLAGSLFVADREWLCEVLRRWLTLPGVREGRSPQRRVSVVIPGAVRPPAGVAGEAAPG